SLYDNAIRDSAADLSALVPLVITSGGGDETFNAQALSSLQANIATNGLPPDVTQFFTGLGFTTSQLDTATTRHLALNPQTISGTMLGSTADMAVDARRVSTQPPSATDVDRDGMPDYALYN